jgi:Uma2 family endonuclease
MTTTLKLKPAIALSDSQFFGLCQNNPDLKFELNSQGDLTIMPPTGGETGKKNAELTADFIIWNRQFNRGIVFDSSTCFALPNGSRRSPDVAWLKKERWEALTPEQQQKFPPLCPDFVLELLSPSDSLTAIQAKMQDYQANGLPLGWLINPSERQVEIYRLNQPVEVLSAPPTLSGETILPHLILNVACLWQ